MSSIETHLNQIKWGSQYRLWIGIQWGDRNIELKLNWSVAGNERLRVLCKNLHGKVHQ